MFSCTKKGSCLWHVTPSFLKKKAKGGRSGCSTSLSCLYHKCVKQTVGLYFNQLQIVYDLYGQPLWIESTSINIYLLIQTIEVVVLYSQYGHSQSTLSPYSLTV